jgi:hypothetical protein
VAVAGIPLAQQRKERNVSYLPAQGVQRHGSAAVGRAREQELRAAEIRRRTRPERIGRVERVELVECLLGRLTAVALTVDPLRELGEAFVEPDVGPDRQPYGVSEPLVRDLVDDRRCVRGVVELRLGLRFQRVADLRRVIDDSPTARVRRSKAPSGTSTGSTAW